MNITLEELDTRHRDEVIEIFNYYIRTSTAAYRDREVEIDFFQNFLVNAEDYPGFAIINQDSRVIGFCKLNQHKAFPTFAETAEVMYFIHPEHIGKGIGLTALNRLQEEAKNRGIRKLLASISTENDNSVKFHNKNGFTECGRFNDIGKKFERYFGVVWMEKNIR